MRDESQPSDLTPVTMPLPLPREATPTPEAKDDTLDESTTRDFPPHDASPLNRSASFVDFPTGMDADHRGSWPDIPGYEIEKELGRGGMGVVYKAKQVGLDRQVALKMILKADFATTEQKLRFQIEAENAARVQHPNIVQVYEIGEHQGQPYFALEFVEGGSLAEWLRSHGTSPAEAAAFIETLARTVHAAHQHGIIHRDLKPANILLQATAPGADATGLADAQAKVTDFGLAKRHDQTEDLTGSGAILGTPSYMSPEQAQGKTKYVGPPADQYSLGVIFYQLLTGQVPFKADTFPNLLMKIVDEEPTPPRSINPSIPLDLQVICLKCLEKDPLRRYDTTEALAEDLKNWREHRPITARPATRTERVVKWCRRYPAIAALIAVSVLAAIIASGLAWWAVAAERQAAANEQQALRERDLKEEQRQRAEARLSQIERAVDLFAGMLTGINPDSEEKEGLTVYEQLAQRAEELTKKLDGDAVGDPLAMTRLQSILGNTLVSLGRADRGLEILNKALATRVHLLGPEHADTLATQVQLANALSDAGHQQQALAILKSVHSIRTRILGSTHPDTLVTACNLGNLHRALGQTEEAISLLEAVRQAEKATNTAENRDSLATLNALALAYADAGRGNDAMHTFEYLLRESERLLGPDHPRTLGSANNLATVRFSKGQRAEAITLLRQVSQRTSKKLGPDHPDSLLAASNLATALADQGHAAERLRLLEQIRDALTRRHGLDHVLVHGTNVSLASALMETGQPIRGLELYEQSCNAMAKYHGSDHPDVLAVKVEWGCAYVKAGRDADAQKLFEETLRSLRTPARKRHAAFASCLINLGDIHLRQGRPAEALVLFAEARACAVTECGPKSPEYLRIEELMANACWRGGKYAESIEKYRHVHQVRRQTLGWRHPDTLAALAPFAGTSREQGSLADARAAFDELHRARQEALGAGNHLTIDAENHLGLTELIMGELAIAEKHLLVSYQKLRADPAPPPGWLACYCYRLVCLYAMKSQPQQVTEWLAEARRHKHTGVESTSQVARFIVNIRQRVQPNDCAILGFLSCLGCSLADAASKVAEESEKKKLYAEAESLLLQVIAMGEASKDATFRSLAQASVQQAAQRLIELYEATGRTAEAAKLRAESFRYRFLTPPPPPAR